MMRRSPAIGGGGARMLRSMGRAVGATVREKVSAAAAAKPAPAVSVSSPPALSSGSLPCYSRLDEWETIGEDREGDIVFTGSESGFGFGDRCVFGPAPTEDEAQEAVSTLQQMLIPVTLSDISDAEFMSSSADEEVVDKVMTTTGFTIRDYSSTESESDWIEPALNLYDSKYSDQSYGHENILDAVRLFQNNQPFKRVVTALSSDPDVWNAVMKNEVVQELRKSFGEAESSEPYIVVDNSCVHNGTLRRILQSTKRKVMELFDMIARLVNEIFHSPGENQQTEAEAEAEAGAFDYFVRSSFMVSVVIFVIVVMKRVHKS